MSEVSLWGEAAGLGALPLCQQLSSLSRINDDLHPKPVHERAGLTHTCTHSHRLTHSPCLIYTDMINPRHATFTLNNVEGRDGCFWFSRIGRHLNGGLNTPRFCLLEKPPTLPSPSPPCLTKMKWTNAKSMFLVLLLTSFIPPPSHCFLAD